MIIQISDIENILGFPIEETWKKTYANYNLNFEYLDKKEFNDYLVDVVNVITSDIVKSGEHRIDEWEKGWRENLQNFLRTNDFFDLIPKYHSKRNYIRWKQSIIKPEDKRLDYYIHTIFVDSIIRHYMQHCDNIFEFGCGPGYHLLRLLEQLPDKNFYGADWTKASQYIIGTINEKLNTNIHGINFNFFKPDYSVEVPENSGIYTVAVLEQIGDKFKDFIDYILVKKPSVCVHLEPIDELLDKNNLLDLLSIKYFRKRNYLNGFLPYLEQLEESGKIDIIKKQRIFTGSYFIEGHSLVVWKVK